MASRLCRSCDGWHDLDEPWPRECANHFKRTTEARSSLPRPMIISDSLDDVVNPIDQKPYSSKAAFYRTVKGAGAEILGNETIKPRDNDTDILPGIERDIAQAYDKAS